MTVVRAAISGLLAVGCLFFAWWGIADSGGSKGLGDPAIEFVYHDCDPLEAQRAEGVAASAWELTLSAIGSPRTRPQSCRVHVFRDEDAIGVEGRVAFGAKFDPRSTVSFSRTRENLAFVVRGSAGALSDEPSPEFLRNVAHEISHLALHAADPDWTKLPQWFTEGLAMQVEGVAADGSDSVHDDVASRIPYWSNRMVACRRLFDAGRLPPPDVIMDDRLDVTVFERYSIQWAFYRFMLEDQMMLPTISGLSTTSGPVARELERLCSRLSSELREKSVATAWQAYVSEMRPSWEQVSGVLNPRGGGWMQRSTLREMGVAWRLEETERRRFAARGRARIINDRGGLAFLLGRSDDGFLAVMFTADSQMGIARFDARDRRWTWLATSNAGMILPRSDFEFSIDGDENELKVRVGSQAVVARGLNLNVRSQWGLAVLPESTGEWSCLDVE